MEYGWPSPAVPLLLDSTRSPVALKQATDGVFWLQTLYVLGGICGLPITCVAANKLGRRRSILMGGMIGALCWLLTGSAGSVEQLYVSR